MELQEETSILGAVSTSTHFSSSSSAFVSASQSPFFSPRSPESRGPDPDSLLVNGLPPGTATIIVRQPDASPAPSFCPSSNFEAAEAFGRDLGCSPCNGGVCSSSNYSQARKGKPKRSSRGHGKLPFARPSPSVSSASRPRFCDVYIGFHGRKPSLLRFANWLRAELELQGMSCFACDRARCRSSRSHDIVERAMDASSFGVVIVAKKSFANPYSIEELRHFHGRKSLCPVFFDLGAGDCLARDIVERRGELWDRHGGELWAHYDGLETEWREAVDGLSRVPDWQLEACEGNWRECISNAVVLLATRLGRRGVVERANRWRERAEREEYPFPRNEDFVGRKKELSELELILFGDVSGDGEREYFELKSRHRRKSLLVGRAAKSHSAKGQQSECSSKGKEPVLWKESEKEIEMQQLRPLRSRNNNNGASYGRRKRPAKILYGKGVACVSGESGIGKTELVLEYAYRFSQRYKMVLWVGGEARYIRQNYLNLRSFLEPDLGVGVENHSVEKGKTRCFEEQEKDSIAGVRRELMRDVPFLVVIDNLESEKDWWDGNVMDLLPRFGGETHFIITTRLPSVMNLEPMKLSYLSGVEALALMKGGGAKDYPVAEVDALRAVEEKLGRLTLGLAIVGAILSELPITPSRLLDTVNRMPLRASPTWDDGEVVSPTKHAFLIQLLDVCLSIFDHADGPRSLAARMVQVSGWFAPAPVPIPLLALTAHKVPKKHNRPARAWGECLDAIACSFSSSSSSRTRRSDAEASSMLTRFGIARHSTRADCVHFHEIVRAYARKRGGGGGGGGGAGRTAQAMVQAVCLRGSVSQHLDHLWAACFLLFGFGNGPAVVEPSPSELMLVARRVVLPLAVVTFLNFSRCNAALELLRLCTEGLELAAESMVSGAAEKWIDGRRFCCLGWGPGRSEARYTYLWQELALVRATVLETRAKLMLRGGRYDAGDDLIRKAIFIRASICGEHHPDMASARETLGKITRLLTNVHE